MIEQKINYIGIVRTSLKNIEDCPLQEIENAPTALLEIFPEYKQGLWGIERGSEVIILTWLHLANRTELMTKPRNDPNANETGVFCTRSPNRPNPIGIHTATVVSLNELILEVSQLEVVEGTPILDIKPKL